MTSAGFTSHRMLIQVALHHRILTTGAALRSKRVRSHFFPRLTHWLVEGSDSLVVDHLQSGISWIQLQRATVGLLPVPVLMITALRQVYNQRRKRTPGFQSCRGTKLHPT